ncbi:MAG: hypothetical protein IPI32_05670 [Austwickia sp.]|nr:hypothetical protein [Austwickia sp.]MBK8435700.1 hypothetical protein [Austwickia sp.]MBK9100733.1 hypothetical protein [Austwickia sp.]
MNATAQPTLVETLEGQIEQAGHRLLMAGGALVPLLVGLVRAVVDNDVDTRSYPTYGPYW